jgi:hypothetical protein
MSEVGGYKRNGFADANNTRPLDGPEEIQMKLYSSLFIAAGILVSGLSFAQSEDRAGPCVHLRNPWQCVNYPTGECFWDADDQRCENKVYNEDACNRLPYNWCVSNPGCFWDAADQRCERRY